MVRFCVQINTFQNVFCKTVHSLLFIRFCVKLHLMTNIKKCVKLIIRVFKEWGIFGPKNTENSQNLLIRLLYKFSKILCDDRHPKGSQRDCVLFFRTTFIIPKNPYLDIFGYKIDIFDISCFTAFLRDRFTVRAWGPLLLRTYLFVWSSMAFCLCF